MEYSQVKYIIEENKQLKAIIEAQAAEIAALTQALAESHALLATVSGLANEERETASKLRDAVTKIEVHKLSPVDAMTKLYELQRITGDASLAQPPSKTMINSIRKIAEPTPAPEPAGEVVEPAQDLTPAELGNMAGKAELDAHTQLVIEVMSDDDTLDVCPECGELAFDLDEGVCGECGFEDEPISDDDEEQPAEEPLKVRVLLVLAERVASTGTLAKKMKMKYPSMGKVLDEMWADDLIILDRYAWRITAAGRQWLVENGG